MAQQFNAIIAEQTDHFRGVSTIQISQTTSNLPNSRAISGSRYVAEVVGGVSGMFSVVVVGHIGGTTHAIAGVTAIAAAGSFTLYHAVYNSGGTNNVIGTVNSVTRHHIDQVVPPSAVLFGSSGSAVGISASVTVSASLQARR